MIGFWFSGVSLVSVAGFSGFYGRLPFTSSIQLEILGLNIRYCSLSERKTEISQNVLVSIGKFGKKRKNTLIKPLAYNF